ncbi:MAG: DUF2666 family protein [Candidatus Micrarchaeota archaeon]|nr:DUF2666 family protein [Candidatus Micrarchaeota archaeon]
MDEPEEYVDFLAKYGNWISIKRLGIRPDTKPEAVAHHLAGISATAGAKSYSYLGIDTSSLDTAATGITAGMRKSYDSLSQAVSKMAQPATKSAVAAACKDPKLAPVAEAYLLNKIITGVGYDTSVNQLTMSKIFPDLKPPKKPLGRKAKAAD